MTNYQKAFLLRIIDREIDLLIKRAEKSLYVSPQNYANPKFIEKFLEEFWQEHPEFCERFTALYAARGQIQVTEVTQ